MSNSSIWPIDRNLSGAATKVQSKPGRDGNEGVLYISQSCSITGASQSDYLVSYPGHSLGESYTSAEMQSVYSIAPGNLAIYYEENNEMERMNDRKIKGINIKKSEWKKRIEQWKK